MPKGLKRYYGLGHLHFLTFSCYRRLPLLKTKHARNLFVHALGKIRERYQFMLVGYVVMPEHVHLLIGEPAKGTPSVVLKVLKAGGPVLLSSLFLTASIDEKIPLPKLTGED